MRTVVAVYGSESKGKSSSIKEFAKELLLAYPLYKVLNGTASIPVLGDFELVLDTGKAIIGIDSMGDPNTNLQNRLKKLADKFHCDVIICSTRTRGETVDAVGFLQDHRSFQTIWTSSYQIANSSSHSFVNNLKGRNILELLVGLGLI